MAEQKGEKPLANVSVAIATLDRPERLKRCLEALLQGQVLAGEIIVIDQSRDDLTRQVVEECQGARAPLVYLRHPGKGLGAAQNMAIRCAKHPVVAVTDDDCVPAEDWVARIEQEFANPGQLDGITGRVLPLDPEAPGLYPVSSRTSMVRADFDRRSMPWDVGSGNNFAVKREWLRRVGGNDERLGPGSPGLGGVDMDLFYRLLRAGARLRYEPDLVVQHAQATKEGRLARRFPYGHGIGAGCLLWLRQGDFNAGRVLARWFLMRSRRFLSGLGDGERLLAYEESLVLIGTLRGLVHGLTLAREPQNARTENI